MIVTEWKFSSCWVIFNIVEFSESLCWQVICVLLLLSYWNWPWAVEIDIICHYMIILNTMIRYFKSSRWWSWWWDNICCCFGGRTLKGGRKTGCSKDSPNDNYIRFVIGSAWCNTSLAIIHCAPLFCCILAVLVKNKTISEFVMLLVWLRRLSNGSWMCSWCFVAEGCW
jgi:hypothetical protein